MEEIKEEIFEEDEELTSEEMVELDEEATPSDILAQAVMRERNMQQVTAKQRVVKILVQVGLYLFLGVMALIVLFPFYWMIISSLKTLDEYELRNPTFYPHHGGGREWDEWRK